MKLDQLLALAKQAVAQDFASELDRLRTELAETQKLVAVTEQRTAEAIAEWIADELAAGRPGVRGRLLTGEWRCPVDTAGEALTDGAPPMSGRQAWKAFRGGIFAASGHEHDQAFWRAMRERFRHWYETYVVGNLQRAAGRR